MARASKNTITSYRNDTKCDVSKDQNEEKKRRRKKKEKKENNVYIEHKLALLAHVRYNIISQ